MKKLALLAMMLLAGISGVSAQDTPPAGTPVIKLTTKPGSTIAVTMRVYDPNMYVWIETTSGSFRKELISADYDNPSNFKIDCPGNTVNLYSHVADFSCSNNKDAITAIDASNNPDLGTLYCHVNAIETLKVTGCPYLIDLSCGKNKLKELDLTGINYLQYLFCYENQLDKLDISHCKLIQELECSSNRLEVLDLSHMSKATTIMCQDNQIKELNLLSCKKLQEFSCAKNQIKTLNLDSCVSLQGFSCGSNLLTSLDVSQCTNLNRLFCSENPNLSEIKLAPNQLQQFSAMECGLQEMTLANMPNLTKAMFSKNPMKAFTLENCDKLNNLVLDQCQISVCDLNEAIKNLPITTGGTLKIAGNPDVETAKTADAQQRGWTVDVQGDGSGCSAGIKAMNEQEIVSTYRSTIEVMTPRASQVAVYDMAGRMVANITTSAHTPIAIPVENRKPYVVAIDQNTHKVFVK